MVANYFLSKVWYSVSWSFTLCHLFKCVLEFITNQANDLSIAFQKRMVKLNYYYFILILSTCSIITGCWEGWRDKELTSDFSHEVAALHTRSRIFMPDSSSLILGPWTYIYKKKFTGFFEHQAKSLFNLRLLLSKACVESSSWLS